MKKLFLMLLMVAILALVACGKPAETGTKVEITITDDGCGLTGSDVLIKNYYKGARAEIEYLINNDSSADIEPAIYVRFNVNPENYSRGENFVPVPTYYLDWLDIPKCGVIEPGMAKSYLLILEIPEDCTEEIPDKWAFKVGVTPQMGFLSNAVATWWRIDMK